jgi:N-acetylneuraminic acid mutarotase
VEENRQHDTARYNHTATLLQNGQVLVTGGSNGNGTLAELYNPSTGTWTVTGSMSSTRTGYAATLLPNGKVLVAGGTCVNGSCVYFSSAELFDPTTGTWTATGSMNTARVDHTATLLSNGLV